jgi:hypothetical protein
MIERDADVDWIIAQNCRGASSINVWRDFSPSSDWKEAGPLIDRYQIDIRYFDPETNPNLESPWMGGLMIKNKCGIQYYCTAYGNTALIASMRALAKSFTDNK